MHRDVVFEAIDLERRYQQKVKNRAKDIGAEIALLQSQLDDARDAWAKQNNMAYGNKPNYDGVMRTFRRMAANLVRSMEANMKAGDQHEQKTRLGEG